MSLRKAAEMALEALEQTPTVNKLFDSESYEKQKDAIDALRQALAQDALKKLAEIDHELGLFIYEPPKREWVGLTDEEAWGVYRTHGLSFHRPNHVEEYEWALCMRDFARDIEVKLKEKNT